jgi:TIR domain-containing protein
MHFRLGKVFISHTAADKPFVRRLAARLKKSQFHTWLDEHDLIAGDPLPQSIGKALQAAKVILIVVSKASVASKWLRYELNLATEKMIKGECRVIPIVIDETPLPAEVRGLLYADCRKGLAAGIPSILTALKHEARRAEMEYSFSSRVDKIVEEVFEGRGWCSPSQYRGQDWEIITMPVPDLDGNERDAFYDVIPDFSRTWRGKTEPLDEGWLAEFEKGVEDTNTDFALIVSERPVQFKVDERSSAFPNVALRRFKWEQLGMTYRHIVVVDFSVMKEEEQQKAALREAKKLLIECGEYKNAETAKLREDAAKKGRCGPNHRIPKAR